jgi:hypothetical protein
MDWLDKATAAYCKLLELLLVVSLAAMVLMVFGNDGGRGDCRESEGRARQTPQVSRT